MKRSYYQETRIWFF